MIPAIQIVIARPNKHDDVVTIRPLADNDGVFSVKYEDRWSEYTYYFEDSWNEVSAYLSQIFAVLPLDRYPFEGVQFSIPAYPSIWINTQDTTTPSVMEPVWSMLDSVAFGWPALIKTPKSAK
jgi:hypothetical protein